ncbi:MAG: hypothetical protein R2705_19650, partial [Ilumatobacteraceae bacterium]
MYGPGGDEGVGLVYGRDGLLDRLTASAGSPDPRDVPGAVWLPDSLATAIGASPGDAISLQLRYREGSKRQEGAAEVRRVVAGIYETNGDRPVLTGTDDGWVPPLDPTDRSGRIALVLMSAPDAMALTDELSGTLFTTWDLPWTGPASLEQGRRAAPSLDRANSLLADRSSTVGRRLVEADARAISIQSAAGRFVDHAEQAAGELEPLVRSISLSGLVIASAIVLGGVWLLARSRRRELELAISEGSSPVRLAVLLTVELIGPIVTGLVAAYGIVRFAPSIVAGSGHIDAATLASSRRALLWRAPLIPIGLAAAGFAAAWPIDTASASRARRVARALNLPAVLVAATVATGAQLLTQSGPALESG